MDPLFLIIQLIRVCLHENVYEALPHKRSVLSGFYRA